MFTIDDYRRIMMLLATYGFNQMHSDPTAFFKAIVIHARAQVVDEPDQLKSFPIAIYVSIRTDKICFKYKKIVALESGKLTGIFCEESIECDPDKFAERITQIINDIILSPNYNIDKFGDSIPYKSNTVAEIVAQSIRDKKDEKVNT